MSCVCDSTAGWLLTRAGVDAVNGDRITLTLDEVLSPPSPNYALGPGDTLTPVYGVGLPCAADEGRTVQVGDVVFAAYRPDWSCNPNGGASTPGCPARAWVVPWGETLMLGGQVQVLASDVASLADSLTCNAQFPGPPAGPCNDTPNTSGSASCAFAVASRRSGVAWLAGVAAWLWMQRARRGKRRAACKRGAHPVRTNG